MKNSELLEELRKAVKEGYIKVHTNLYGYIQLINSGILEVRTNEAD